MNIFAFFREHWFWGLLTLAVLAWYSSITLYVSYKGLFDIRDLLRNLAKDHAQKQVHK